MIEFEFYLISNVVISLDQVLRVLIEVANADRRWWLLRLN